MCSRPWARTFARLDVPSVAQLLLCVAAGLAAPVLLASCASSGRSAERPENHKEVSKDVTVVRHVDRADPDPPALRLAGARCENAGAAGCTCRQKGGDDTEKAPPAAGSKRLEIRLSIDEGEGALEAPTLGRFSGAGARETCYYVDVPVGSKHGFNFTGRARNPERGFTPRFVVSAP